MSERPSALTCPECGGALRPVAGTAPLQYRCHIGHLFGGSELSPAQLQLLEKALDTASRVLNERIELARQMAENAKTNGHVHNGRYWQKVQAEAEAQAEAIRSALTAAQPNGGNGGRRDQTEPEPVG